MDFTIDFDQVEPRLVALVHVEAVMTEIPAAITRGYSEIFEALSAAGQPPAGPPLVIYDGPMLPNQPMTFAPAVPVAGDFSPAGTVSVEEVPGGRVLAGTHQGSYQELGTAHRAMMDEVVRLGMEIAGPPREIYLNDPTGTAEADLLTRLEYPVAAVND